MVENKGCGCGAGMKKIRQIEVGGEKTGIAGILEIYKEYYDKGKDPEEIDGEELLEVLGGINHIPEDREDEYKEALMREYKRYYRDRENNRPPKLLKK